MRAALVNLILKIDKQGISHQNGISSYSECECANE